MDIQCITERDDFLSLGSVWNNFLEQNPNNTVSLTHDWLKCWWHAYGKNSRLFVLLARDNDELVGMVPLRITMDSWRGVPIRKLGFMANSSSPRSDFLFKNEDVLIDIIRYIAARKGWDIALFENIPRQSGSWEIIQETLQKMGLHHKLEEGLCSPVISVDSDWETYFSGLSSKFRKQLRNKINRVHKLGDYSIVEVNTPEQWKIFSSEVFAVSERSWKGRNGTSISSIKEKRGFIEELSESAGQNGWLSVWLLRVNDQPIAIEYHLKYNGEVYALLGDFDEEYRDCSPGSFLERHIMEHIFRNGYRRYDMCGNDYEYKMRWTSEVREHVNLIVFNRGIYSSLLRFGELRMLPLLRRCRIISMFKKIFSTSP